MRGPRASPTKRERLPNRRRSEIFGFEHDGHRYLATVSRFADGRPAELFLGCGKAGAAVSAHAQDAAILTSLLLQHGVSPAAIEHWVSGPIATALNHLGARGEEAGQ